MDDVGDLVATAREHLLLDSRWYGLAAMRLQSIADPTVKTALTDGTVMRWNPDYMASLTPRQRKTVWAHEVSHCTLRHLFRLAGKDLATANRAADYVVNHQLSQDAGLELPPGALLDPQYGDDWDFERVYAHLRHQDEQAQQNKPPGATDPGQGQQPPQAQPGQGQPDPAAQPPQAGQPDPTAQGQPQPPQSDPTAQPGQGGQPDPNAQPQAGQGGMGDFEQPATADAAKGTGDQLSEGDWSLYAEAAEAMMSKAGKMPAGVSRALRAAKQAPQDWRELLADFISRAAPTDTSWARPSRRYLAAGHYLPGAVRETVGPIVVAIDTSGSVSRAMLDAMAAELTALARDARPEYVQVVYHDTRVYDGPRFEPDDDVKLDARGGGGTRFQPVVDWLAELDEPPLCVVWMTDLDSHDRPSAPDVPVIFATPGHVRRPAPFGDVVRMTL